MSENRDQLVRLRDRRRRCVRLLLVCAATALACGMLAGAAAPRLLIGGVPQAGRTEVAQAAAVAAVGAPDGPAAESPLALAARLCLDPREIQANQIRWASMSDAQRRTLLAKYWRLAGMPEADQSRLIDQYLAFRDLPEKRQEVLRTRAKKLRAFVESLSPQDQAILESMGDTDRARRILELWQARHKTW